MRHHNPDAGFTLVEILIVAAIIGILVAIAVPGLHSAVSKARQRASMSDMRTIANSLHMYAMDARVFPATMTMAQLEPILVPFVTHTFPSADGWKNDFSYECDGVSNYTLESYGADGLPGADISIATRFDFNRDIVFTNGIFTASPD
jgi:type II secretion system protein G